MDFDNNDSLRARGPASLGTGTWGVDSPEESSTGASTIEVIVNDSKQDPADVEAGKDSESGRTTTTEEEKSCWATEVFCDWIYKDVIVVVCTFIFRKIDDAAHCLCLGCSSKISSWCYNGLSRHKENKLARKRVSVKEGSALSSTKNCCSRICGRSGGDDLPMNDEESDHNKKQRAVGNAGTCEVCCAWLIILPLCKAPVDCLRIVSMENDLRWRQHLAIAKKNDPEALLTYYGDRFQSMIIFMTLLLTVLTGALFSTAEAPAQVNSALWNADNHWHGIANTTLTAADHVDGNTNEGLQRVPLMAGVFNILAIIFTMSTIVAAFTVWGIIAALSRRNAVMVLSTPIGLIATQFPFYLLSIAIVLTFVAAALYLRVMVPLWLFLFYVLVTILILVVAGLAFVLLARLVMHSGAMQADDVDIEERQRPTCLDEKHDVLEKWKGKEMWEQQSAKGLQDKIFERAWRLRNSESENTHSYATFEKTIHGGNSHHE